MKKSNLRILVIEDSIDDADLVRRMLNRAGDRSFTVVHARLLAEGVRSLREQAFDVVLLDLGLPDSEGIEAIQDVRKACPGVPLIVLSGVDDEEVALEALNLDVQDYLIKGQTDGNLLVRSIRYARERKRSREALRTSESRFRRLSESGVLGIASFDISGRISDANDTLLSMIGYSREDLAEGGVRWDRLLPPEWTPHMRKVADAFTKTGRIEPYETEYLRRDGTRSWGLFGAARIDGTGEGVAFIVDITGRKKLEQEIRHMANHDPVTGLPNRRLFQELIRFEFAEADRNRKKTGLLFLDLDRFKEVNDTLGHEAGDELLTMVADRLKSAVRKADAVARIGGDEFGVLLADISCPADISEIVRKITAAVREPCILSGRQFGITTSVGISLYPDDGDDVNTLFHYADIALYRAKKNGRDLFEFYDAGMIVGSLPGISPC